MISQQCKAINDAACKIVAEVAKPAGCLIAGGLSQTPTYLEGKLETVEPSLILTG